MPDHLMPVYREPCLDACKGEALLHHDVAGHYRLGDAAIVTIQPQREFTALEGADGATHYIRTTDFQRVCPEPLRAVYCSCGQLVVGLDAAHLFQWVRVHADHAHPDLALTDDQVRAVITANAFALDHLQLAS
jgi:hypothetical protein